MKRLHINKRLDQLRDYDENHPRELKKYLMCIGAFVLLEGFLNFFLSFIFIFVFFIFGMINGTLLGMRDFNTNEKSTPELKEELYSQEELNEEISNYYFGKSLISKCIGGFFFMSSLFYFLGQFIIGTFTINFPILLDIKWDTNWLYVNPMYLIRTFFNLVQFMIMFYIIMKIKRKIRYKIDGIINNNMDFFDKEFFKSVI